MNEYILNKKNDVRRNMNNYKGDIDTNRTDRFSSLYVIVSKIGLGCVTYFMVGLCISMIYVLSDMDYFTLNGQFRNQRFFTDDGYYYTKQLVIIYGLLSFILTMFIGPVGIIPCIIWTWLLTISFISISVYMNSTNPDKYNKLLIRFICFISFISHSLLCNFIFYLFYPMNSMFSSYIYDYDIKLTNTSNNSNNINSSHNDSRSSYTFYRILSFMSGYFIGCSLLSFVLSINTDINNSLYPINNHNNNMKLLIAMLIASSISMLTSLLLSFQFIYEYIIRIRLIYKYSNNNDSNTSVTNIHNDFIDRSRYMLDTGTFVWFPINKHTNNFISKNFHTIIDIELLVVWILNPFIITLIPYNIPSHSQFRKQSYIHKLLFSLIFIIIFMFLNDDLIFSYLFPTEFMNSSVFNIVYSNQYIQLKDDHLYINPVSMSNINYFNCGFNTNSNFDNINIFNNTISSVQNSHSSFVSYPHFDDILDYVHNEHVLLSSFIYEIFKLLHISQNSVFNINSFSFNENTNIDNNEFSIYFYNEYNFNMMLVSSNPIDSLVLDISIIIDTLIQLGDFYNLNLFPYSFLNKLNSDDVYTLSSSNIKTIYGSKSSIVSLFKTHYNTVLTNQEDASNVQTINSNFLYRDKSKVNNSLILNLISTVKLKNVKVSVSTWKKYTDKALKILKFLKRSENCKCYIKLKPTLCFPNDFFQLKNGYDDSNPYPVFYEMMDDRIGNHLCLCIIIMYILRPSVLICIRYFVDSILDMAYTSNRKFDKNKYLDNNEHRITKFVAIIFNLLNSIIDILFNKLYYSRSKCFCLRYRYPYYHFLTNIIIYISSFFEDVFKNDNGKIENTKHLSNLFSMIEYSEYSIGLRGSSVVYIKDCECVCESSVSETCKCKCDKGQANECCCIICKNCKIICLTICFGCRLCCICCDKPCQCHTNVEDQCLCNENSTKLPCVKRTVKFIFYREINVKSRFLMRIVRYSSSFLTFKSLIGIRESISTLSILLQETTLNISCPCKNVCEAVKNLGSGTCTNNECCKKLCEILKTSCQHISSITGNNCCCKEISDKLQDLSSNCVSLSEEVKKKIIDKVKCDVKRTKCCCKIGLSTIRLLNKASKCISYYLYNQATLQCLDCCKQIETKRIIYLNTINRNYKNIIITSKNNRICDTMCNTTKASCIDENNNMSIGQNLSGDHTNNSIKHNNHKLKQSNIIISLGLIFLILCLRMSFDMSDDNKHIYKSNRQITHYNIEDNNLLGSMYNIFVNNNMKDYTLNRNGEYGTNTNNSNIKQNKMIYFMTMLISLISALYMNMVIRNMYDKLRLEYDIWSYLINMILMTGMMSSLLTKYSVHIFDFVGVLDKYGMNLSKDGILLNVVEGNKIIDEINAPVKNMMMYGLFKSMTKDLSSLIRYTDVSKTTSISSSKTTYSKMKNKLYPYKEMTRPIHRITKYCDKCQHSLCKIHRSVINNLGNKESIDIVSVLDFLSYTMIYNHMSFINQYESYFSGDELYMIWKLNKHINNNMFVTEYYRHQTLNKIEQEIKQLINGDKLGSYNLMLLWEIFGENEIRNITLKSMSDINDQQMIQNQRDILLSMLYNEYLIDFYKFAEYVCNTYLNTRLVTKSKSLSVNNIVEFTNILNKHILDKSTIQHLANIYTKNTHDRKIKSLMLPTVICNITGTIDEVKTNVKSYCNDWLKNKLLFCKHIKSPYCEEAVNIAYNTIIDLVDKPGNLYNNIFDLLTNMDLKQMDNIFEKPTDYIPKLIQPICKDCESLSLYYINQYLSESLVNIDRMLRPLGMYLSWNGTPILSQHLHKYGHKY